jgi:transcriptional regulator with XRE-family HTH domain
MPRPRTVDLLVRQTVARELRRFFSQSRTSKASLAKRLGISRQALYTYVSASSTPSAEVLARLASIEGIGLFFQGRRFDPGPTLSTAKTESLDGAAENVQYDLPFDTPIVITGTNQAVSVEIRRKDAGVVEVAVRLRAG